MNVPASVKNQVQDVLKDCIKRAEDRYGRKFETPVVLYNLKGKTAGSANCANWVIKLNAVLLMENLDNRFIEDTVPHELAHLIDYKLHPENFNSDVIWRGGQYRRTKRSLHGPTWKAIMRALGQQPDRTHNYDTSNSIGKRTTKHVYNCRTCGKVMTLGPKRHMKMQSGVKYFLRSCRHHNGFVYKGIEGPAPMPVAARAPKTPRTSAGTSKLDHCRSWYNSTLSRAENIKNFIDQCCCTPAGAATYYATIKKERRA